MVNKNMSSFELEEVGLLVEKILDINSDKAINKTEYRRLFMAYSSLKEQ